jgi:AcrR family transcriptional regulator
LPKETFAKLPDEKKDRIFGAAVKEFSVRRFSEASLNQIMKAAGIPWGSFYQYFEDKRDLFAYTLSRISEELGEMEAQKRANSGEGDALAQFSAKLASTIELNARKPEYAQIAMVQARESDPFVKRHYELQEDHKRMAAKLFERDKERGLIREDVDAEAVIDMVYILSKETFLAIGLDADAYQKKMDAFIKVIREGIRRS